MTKVIIEAAVNGSRLPTESPYLPITPDEIADHIVAASEAGAAIAHYHARDPRTGRPSVSADIFREIATKVKGRCSVVLCPAIEVDIDKTTEERLAVVADLQPEMAAFSLGPRIYPAFELLKKYSKFKHSWEREYLERSYDSCDHFSFEVMETCGRTMAKYGTRAEIAVFDTFNIDRVSWMLEEGIVDKPLYLPFVLESGVRSSVDYVTHLYNTARGKLGDFNFTVAGGGDAQMSMVGVSLALGGQARVGLGDCLRNARGEFFKSSAEQVTCAVEIAEGMGLEIATPDDAREMLEIKGLDKVSF